MWEKLKTWYRLYFTDYAYELAGRAKAEDGDNKPSSEDGQASVLKLRKQHRYTDVEIELLKSSIKAKEVAKLTGLTYSQVNNYRQNLKRRKA